MGICHLIFSEKSDTLITIEVGVKSWNYRLLSGNVYRLNPEITIELTLRAEISKDHFVSTRKPPSFDEINEEYLMIAKDGLYRYDIDGKSIGYSSESFSIFAVNPFNIKILTFDSQEGLCD